MDGVSADVLSEPVQIPGKNNGSHSLFPLAEDTRDFDSLVAKGMLMPVPKEGLLFLKPIGGIVEVKCFDPLWADGFRRRTMHMCRMSEAGFFAAYSPITEPGGALSLVRKGKYSRECVTVAKFWRKIDIALSRAHDMRQGAIILMLGAHTPCADGCGEPLTCASDLARALAAARERYRGMPRIHSVAVVHDMRGQDFTKPLPKCDRDQLTKYPAYQVR